MVRFNHRLQARFVAAVAAVAIGVERADHIGVAHPQRAAIGIERQTQRGQGTAFSGTDQPAIIALSRLARAGAGADRIERIGKIGPTRRLVDPGGGGKSSGLALPAVHRMLRGKDFIGAHPGEPIVSGVKLTDVIEAIPAVIARTIIAAIKARQARTRRAKLARLGAARGIASAILPSGSSMESIMLHPFHMGNDRLEGKS